jgi:hypothetical protein
MYRQTSPPINKGGQEFIKFDGIINKIEAFEKCLFLFKFKGCENFNHRHTLSISRIKI